MSAGNEGSAVAFASWSEYRHVIVMRVMGYRLP
jgi:hypothetical protein